MTYLVLEVFNLARVQSTRRETEIRQFDMTTRINQKVLFLQIRFDEKKMSILFLSLYLPSSIPSKGAKKRTSGFKSL